MYFPKSFSSFSSVCFRKRLFRQGANLQTDGDLSESSCYPRIQDRSYIYCHKSVKKQSIHPCCQFYPQKTLLCHKRNGFRKGTMEQNIRPKKNITCDPHETLSTAILNTHYHFCNIRHSGEHAHMYGCVQNQNPKNTRQPSPCQPLCSKPFVCSSVGGLLVLSHHQRMRSEG